MEAPTNADALADVKGGKMEDHNNLKETKMEAAVYMNDEKIEDITHVKENNVEAPNCVKKNYMEAPTSIRSWVCSGAVASPRLPTLLSECLNVQCPVMCKFLSLFNHILYCVYI